MDSVGIEGRLVATTAHDGSIITQFVPKASSTSTASLASSSQRVAPTVGHVQLAAPLFNFAGSLPSAGVTASRNQQVSSHLDDGGSTGMLQPPAFSHWATPQSQDLNASNSHQHLQLLQQQQQNVLPQSSTQRLDPFAPSTSVQLQQLSALSHVSHTPQLQNQISTNTLSSSNQQLYYQQPAKQSDFQSLLQSIPFSPAIQQSLPSSQHVTSANLQSMSHTYASAPSRVTGSRLPNTLSLPTGAHIRSASHGALSSAASHPPSRQQAQPQQRASSQSKWSNSKHFRLRRLEQQDLDKAKRCALVSLSHPGEFRERASKVVDGLQNANLDAMLAHISKIQNVIQILHFCLHCSRIRLSASQRNEYDREKFAKLVQYLNDLAKAFPKSAAWDTLQVLLNRLRVRNDEITSALKLDIKIKRLQEQYSRVAQKARFYILQRAQAQKHSNEQLQSTPLPALLAEAPSVKEHFAQEAQSTPAQGEAQVPSQTSAPVPEAIHSTEIGPLPSQNEASQVQNISNEDEKATDTGRPVQELQRSDVAVVGKQGIPEEADVIVIDDDEDGESTDEEAVGEPVSTLGEVRGQSVSSPSEALGPPLSNPSQPPVQPISSPSEATVDSKEGVRDHGEKRQCEKKEVAGQPLSPVAEGRTDEAEGRTDEAEPGEITETIIISRGEVEDKSQTNLSPSSEKSKAPVSLSEVVMRNGEDSRRHRSTESSTIAASAREIEEQSATHGTAAEESQNNATSKLSEPQDENAAKKPFLQEFLRLVRTVVPGVAEKPKGEKANDSPTQQLQTLTTIPTSPSPLKPYARSSAVEHRGNTSSEASARPLPPANKGPEKIVEAAAFAGARDPRLKVKHAARSRPGGISPSVAPKLSPSASQAAPSSFFSFKPAPLPAKKRPSERPIAQAVAPHPAKKAKLSNSPLKRREEGTKSEKSRVGRIPTKERLEKVMMKIAKLKNYDSSRLSTRYYLKHLLKYFQLEPEHGAQIEKEVRAIAAVIMYNKNAQDSAASREPITPRSKGPSTPHHQTSSVLEQHHSENSSRSLERQHTPSSRTSERSPNKSPRNAEKRPVPKRPKPEESASSSGSQKQVQWKRKIIETRNSSGKGVTKRVVFVAPNGTDRLYDVESLRKYLRKHTELPPVSEKLFNFTP